MGGHRVSGGGGQRARRGAVRDALLVVLAERPMHGYDLITEIEARSSGRWRPSPGSVYPALARMEEQGLIRSDEVEEKKVFSITAKGRKVSEALEIDRDDPTPARWREAGDSHAALRALPAEITGQARQIRRFGTPEQIDRAAALLDEVKRELYAILAHGPTLDAHPNEDDIDT